MFLYVLVKGEIVQVLDIPRCDRYTLGDTIKIMMQKWGDNAIVITSKENITDIVGYVVGLE